MDSEKPNKPKGLVVDLEAASKRSNSPSTANDDALGASGSTPEPADPFTQLKQMAAAIGLGPTTPDPLQPPAGTGIADAVQTEMFRSLRALEEAQTSWNISPPGIGPGRSLKATPPPYMADPYYGATALPSGRQARRDLVAELSEALTRGGRELLQTQKRKQEEHEESKRLESESVRTLRDILSCLQEQASSLQRLQEHVRRHDDAIETLRAGTPGRPSLKNLFLEALDRRIAAGTIEVTLSAESKALRAWFLATYPKAIAPALKTIRNHIRVPYRSAKESIHGSRPRSRGTSRRR